MEKKELKERFFDRFFYAEDGSCDWDRWRRQDPDVVWDFIEQEIDRAREEGIKNIFTEEESMENKERKIPKYCFEIPLSGVDYIYQSSHSHSPVVVMKPLLQPKEPISESPRPTRGEGLKDGKKLKG